MQIIGNCPVCGDALNVTSLKCGSCNIEISGNFTLSKFDSLSKSEIKFIELFLVNQGNIKEMEKELQVSYPTVKNNWTQLFLSLDYKVNIQL